MQTFFLMCTEWTVKIWQKNHNANCIKWVVIFCHCNLRLVYQFSKHKETGFIHKLSLQQRRERGMSKRPQICQRSVVKLSTRGGFLKSQKSVNVVWENPSFGVWISYFFTRYTKCIKQQIFWFESICEWKCDHHSAH